MLLLGIRLFFLLAIALFYAIFDVFNNRNVPNLFVYATLAIAFLITLTYDIPTIYLSLALALAMGAIGYLFYRAGLLGAGDTFEFITISLILPIWSTPLLSNLSQFNLPFILSVFISTGYVSIFSILIYYLFFAKKSKLEKGFAPSKRAIATSALIFIFYIAFILMINKLIGATPAATIIILFMAITSSILLIYEKLINMRMISSIYPRHLEEGDMIATNLMNKEEISYFKQRSKLFGRLATQKMINQIKDVRKKIPVYRNAAPLAAFLFFGIIISLVFGNLVLYIINV